MTEDQHRSLNRSVLVNVLLTILALVSSGLVPFGFNLVVGRVEGAASLGEISVALGMALFLGQIPGTVGAAATKFMAESLGRQDEERSKSVFQLLFVVTTAGSCCLGIAVFLLSPLLESLLHISAGDVALSAVLIPTYTLYLYFKSVYYGIQKVRPYLLNEVASDVAFFAVLGAIFLFHGSTWLLIPFVLNNLIFAVIAAGALREYFVPFGFGRGAGGWEVLKYCSINGTGTIASLGRWSLGTTISGIFLSHASVGVFAAALAITAPLPLLPRAISLVTFAAMARLHGAGESHSVRHLLQQSTEWLAFILGLPFGLAIINASGILSLLFNPEFARGAVAAQLIMLGQFITDISRPSIDALSSTDHVRIPTIASFLGLGVSLAIWLILLPGHGIDVAGAGFAVGAFATAAIPAYFAYRLVGTRPAVFLRPAIMLAGIGCLMIFGQSAPLLSSVVFVIALFCLYAHILGDVVGYARTQYRHRKAGMLQRSV